MVGVITDQFSGVGDNTNPMQSFMANYPYGEQDSSKVSRQ